jgi:hypothetical protein
MLGAMRRIGWVFGIVAALACGDDGGDADTDAGTTSGMSTTDGGPQTNPPDDCPTAGCPTGSGASTGPSSETTSGTTGPDGTTSPDGTGSDDGGTTMVRPVCPEVDASDPQLYALQFTAADADAEATLALGTQLGHLDTRVESLGVLVVYLHGAGAPTTCGSGAHGEMLAGQGFHVFAPCYVSDYGVGNCGDDIGGCRLEAFEGMDHSAVVDVGPPDSIETRVVRGLEHLQTINPEGDWTCFLDEDTPRWDRIIISGISHGASTSALIGVHRVVQRVVSLSGPLDTGQAWLEDIPLTPLGRYYGFTHTGDSQHDGHLEAFEVLGWLGEPTTVDDMDPPYGGSHRLVSSAATTDGHGSTQAGGSSPMSAGEWTFLPVWQYMYGVP